MLCWFAGRHASQRGGDMRGFLALVVMFCASPAEPATFDHVRSAQAPIRAWIVDGYDQSSTFRALVDEIEDLAGIVYIDATVAVPRGLDGALLHWVSGSSELPLLRVMLRPGLSRVNGIATIAHELQHVAEFLRSARTADSATMTAVFLSIDTDRRNGSSRFETEEARQVSVRVSNELDRSRKRE
jgi:hypothetical protein